MTSPLTDQPLDLDPIEAREKAATKGPWTVSQDYDDVLDSQGAHLASYWNPSSRIRNGEFIAHARTDVPAMAAEIRRLRTELATARAAAITDVGDWLNEVGEKDAAYLVRTVDIPTAAETHVVADDSDNPDRCSGCRYVPCPDCAAVPAAARP